MLVSRSIGLSLIAALVFGLSLSSCALVGGTGERLRHAKGYTIEPAANWHSQDAQDGDSAYRLPSGGVVTLVSSCGNSQTAPLDVLARQLLFGLRDLNVAEREKRAFGPNEGLYTRAQGTLSGTKLNLALFTTVRNSCVFDFSMINPKPIPAAEEKQFSDYLASFRYGRD